MISAIKTALSFSFVFIAPLLYYTGNKLRLPSPASATQTDPEITRLRHYLQIRSDHGTPDYPNVVKFLNATARSILPQASLTEVNFKPNKPTLILRIPGARPYLPSVLLNSHTDVVPAETEKWSSPPFDAHVRTVDGQARVYARGAQDMKSIGLAYVESVSNLLQTGWKPLRTIYITFVPDEEIGGASGMGSLVDSEHLTKMNVGVALDEGIPNERPSFHVFYGERQNWVGRISVKNAPGHGATLPRETAIGTLSEILTRLLDFRGREERRLAEGTPIGNVVNVNVPYLQSGTVDDNLPGGHISNVIASEAHIGLDIRVPPTKDRREMEAEVESWLTCDGERCSGATLEWFLKTDIPIVTSRDPEVNPYIRPFEHGLRKAGIEDRLEHAIFFAATDGRYLRKKGIPCFGFSPIERTPNLLHKHDEYISVDGYHQAIRIYQALIRELADFDDQPDFDSERQHTDDKTDL